MRGHAYSAQWGLIDNKKHKEDILKQLAQPGAILAQSLGYFKYTDLA
jgi:hypothetical protein